MDKQTLRIDRQGRIQIPIDFRKALKIESGDNVISWVEDGQIIMQPREVLLAKLLAEFEGLGGSVVDELIQERREEALRDG